MNTPELHFYFIRRWSGKFNPRMHLFNHAGVFEFDPTPDIVNQVLWAYAMRMGVDLVYVYEAAQELFESDPAGIKMQTEYAAVKNFIAGQTAHIRNMTIKYV